tara:strand:- start:131 stop:283 length:153 start_codon:yes stop_codon:yes gene_type:complete
MFGDLPNDAALRAGWDEFRDRLKRAGDLLFRCGAPTWRDQVLRLLMGIPR